MGEPVSIAVGIAGIVLAFRGVVDTYNLFELIISKDNGSRHLALRYNIERHKTIVWGDEFRASDEKESPLLRESRSTRMLIAGILAEMRATYEVAEKYVGRYDMESLPGANFNSGGSLGMNSVLVNDIKIARESKHQKNRLKWGLKDKANFSELVNRMQSLNTELYNLVHVDSTASLANALSTYLLPQLKDALSLVALQQKDLPFDPLLALSARLKQLQDAPLEQTAKEVNVLFLGQQVKLERDKSYETRSFGHLERSGQLPQKAWVEWKRIPNQLSPKDVDLVLLRLQALAAILATPKTSEFRIPPCAGLLKSDQSAGEPSGRNHRHGFVYTWPSEVFSERERPKTLLGLISVDDSTMPLLNDRFDLAYALASALSLFHASKWIHKGFRSDNILFFAKESEDVCIRSPQITGFEYSRPEGQASLGNQLGESPELDVYYHPDAFIQGFNYVRDIYSLGVVLFEVALWSPMSKECPAESGVPLAQMTAADIRACMLRSLPALGAQMGSSYRDAVHLCLSGALAPGSGDNDDAGERLSRSFFTGVLKRLGSCRV